MEPTAPLSNPSLLAGIENDRANGWGGLAKIPSLPVSPDTLPKIRALQ